jgi:hypothetical protein
MYRIYFHVSLVVKGPVVIGTYKIQQNTDLKDIGRLDEAESLVGGLQVVQSLPHVALQTYFSSDVVLFPFSWTTNGHSNQSLKRRQFSMIHT